MPYRVLLCVESVPSDADHGATDPSRMHPLPWRLPTSPSVAALVPIEHPPVRQRSHSRDCTRLTKPLKRNAVLPFQHHSLLLDNTLRIVPDGGVLRADRMHREAQEERLREALCAGQFSHPPDATSPSAGCAALNAGQEGVRPAILIWNGRTFPQSAGQGIRRDLGCPGPQTTSIRTCIQFYPDWTNDR